MNNMRKVMASLLAALLLVSLSFVASGSHNRGPARPGEEHAASTAAAPQNTQAQPETMNAEEKIVRDVYARLMRYQSASRDEVDAREGKQSAPEDYLTFELRKFHSGPTQEIQDRQLSELATPPNIALITTKPVRLAVPGGPQHAYYEAAWTLKPEAGALAQAGNNTKFNIVFKDEPRFTNFNRYTSYEARVHLQGKSFSYRALALYQVQSTAAQASSRPSRVEIIDNVTSGMNTVYGDDSALARAPWNKYIKTALYRAIAKSIQATLESGEALMPADAPIGYLPGDDAATTYSTDSQPMLAPIDGGGGGDDGGGGTGGGGTTTCNTTVDRIQYQSGTTFVDITGTLYVLKDTPVTFKAVPNPATATFASGQPVWSGTSGATGTGETVSVTFSTASTTLTNFKTVIATAGNSVTVNVIVYTLTGVLTAQDNFTGRSNTQFGVGEVINLSFTATPAVTAAQAGGLLWKQTTGSGTLTAATDGTGTYTAANSPESVTLKLEVQAGPSKGRGPDSNISVIAPSGAYQVQNPGTNIRHTQGTCSAGFQAITYLLPKTVSFTHIEAREGTVQSSATGWLSNSNNFTHPTGSWFSVANCNSSTGCQIQALDGIYNEYPQFYGGTQWGNGVFDWNIPREWRIGTGAATQYTTLLHHFVSDAAGKGTISKGGAGPFSKNANDPTSTF